MYLYVFIHVNAFKRSYNATLLLIVTTFRVGSAGVELEAVVKTD